MEKMLEIMPQLGNTTNNNTNSHNTNTFNISMFLNEHCKNAMNLTDFIQSLPNGLDTVVGERGHRLSGGEKQRLAIARLLLKQPSLVILDEATAHLDSDNEALVQSALKEALVGRTSIVIAHRLSTIRDADRIVVLDDGLIMEQGTHDELMALDAMYASQVRAGGSFGLSAPSVE